MSVYGPPGNEELYHWKYVRKYKKNGKWRYVYPNDKFGIKEKISTNVTGSAYDQHRKELDWQRDVLLDTANKRGVIGPDDPLKDIVINSGKSIAEARDYVDSKQKFTLKNMLHLSTGDILDEIFKKKKKVS